MEQNVPQHQGSPCSARDALAHLWAPDVVAGRCQGLWLEDRKGGTSAKWLDACPEIWLGYPNLILAQLAQVFPLLRLLFPHFLAS